MKISDLILTLIAEIQEEANRIADASRVDTPEGRSSPNLNLERLIQQAQADTEIAGYCTTDKSRKDRRAALVRAGACTLLALFEMDREKMQMLREAMSKCPECGSRGDDTPELVGDVGDEVFVDRALHAHGLGFMANGPPTHEFEQDPGGCCAVCGDIRASLVHDPDISVGIDPGKVGGDSTGIVKVKQEGDRLVVLESKVIDPIPEQDQWDRFSGG